MKNSPKRTGSFMNFRKFMYFTKFNFFLLTFGTFSLRKSNFFSVILIRLFYYCFYSYHLHYLYSISDTFCSLSVFLYHLLVSIFARLFGDSGKVETQRICFIDSIIKTKYKLLSIFDFNSNSSNRLIR